MDIRKVARAAVLLGVVAAPVVAAGCHSLDRVRTTVEKNIPAQFSAAPATQLICVWQRRPVPLPDATNDGSQVFGLPGQAYLLNSQGLPADVAGDITIVVYDETNRPDGRPPHQPQVWHYTADVLKRLGTRDDRFGGCIALFLPWPPEWRDVTDVHVTGRYDSPGHPTLFERGAKVTLDLEEAGPKVWQDVDPTRPGLPPSVQTTAFETRNVPDPAKLMRQMQPGGVQQAGTQPSSGQPPFVQTGSTGFAVPRRGQVALPSDPATFLQQQQQATPPGGFQPIIIHPKR